MSQLMKNTRPVNGVIELYLYELTKEQIAQKMERAQLKRSKQELSSSNIMESQLSNSPGRNRKKFERGEE